MNPLKQKKVGEDDTSTGSGGGDFSANDKAAEAAQKAKDLLNKVTVAEVQAAELKPKKRTGGCGCGW